MARPTYDAGKKKKLELGGNVFSLAKSAGSKEAVAWSSSSCVHVCMHTCLLAVVTRAHVNSNILLALPWSSHFALLQSLPVSRPVTKNLHFTKIQKGEERAARRFDATLLPFHFSAAAAAAPPWFACVARLLAKTNYIRRCMVVRGLAGWLALAAPSLHSGRGVSANFQRLLWLVYD